MPIRKNWYKQIVQITIFITVIWLIWEMVQHLSAEVIVMQVDVFVIP